MSTFTNRLSSLSEFSVGAAKFAVMEVKGSWIKCAQTHKFGTGDLLDAYDLTDITDGVLNVENGISTFPGGFVIPQTHSALDTVKASIADLDNQNFMVCPTCEAAGVTTADMTNACPSCVNNAAAIAYLKTV